MKTILDITNREEVVEKLADLLMQFDKDMNRYQTDVYMYIDEETGTATLNTFENVGGNSWLKDDHLTIYSDMEHYETMYDYIEEMKPEYIQRAEEIIENEEWKESQRQWYKDPNVTMD